MSSDVAIRVEGLGKRYRIGGPQASYQTLRESVTDTLVAPFKRLARIGQPRSAEETIWALKDVNFDIKRGEVVGIIGRNGAGKSTLLKILSRITEPTEGSAEIHGRVGSLLEVGTGFHPELTGRENVYLNGAILGMKKAEIDRKFDEMVAFAEVEKFIDTPVKHYSSGMYVRMAFAVAAHLQPEILLVDEVLAVGDVEFQKKCIGRMEKISSEGRTVLVVSHSMSTVKSLCSRAVLLEQGRLKAIGSVESVTTEYLKGNKADAAEKLVTDADHRTGVRSLRLKRIRLLNPVTNNFVVYWKRPISISLELEVIEAIAEVAFGAGIRGMDGSHILTVHHDDDGRQRLWSFEPGRYTVEFTLQNELRPGLYKLHVGADQGHLMMKNVCALDVVNIEVLDHDQDGSIPLASNDGFVNGNSSWKPPERMSGSRG